MKKFLIPSAMALGLMACTETQETIVYQGDFIPYKKGDQISLWQHLEDNGVAEYFDDMGIMPAELATPDKNQKCEDGLQLDGNTVYFDEMEGIYQEGTLVDGVCGKAVSLKTGEVAPLSINMVLPMEKGTVEFWFKPGEDFFEKDARTLLGNDEARVHFFVQDGRIIFQKNHADRHFFAEGKLELDDGWNKIAGQWDGSYMSVWVNDKLVAKTAHALGYEPSDRGYTFGNLIVVGYKSRCCMEGPGQFDAMTTSGAYDQVRISNVPRYSLEDAGQDTVSSSSFEGDVDSSSSVFEVVESSSSVDEDVESSSSIDTLIAPTIGLPVPMGSCVQSRVVFDEGFDRDYEYGITLTEGHNGKAGTFARGDKLVLDAINDSLSQGTFYFVFKPGESFADMRNAALVGSDEGRLTFKLENGEICFYKNLSNDIIKTCAVANLKDDWNIFAGQWDGKSISLYVNDELLSSEITATGYSPSTRGSYVAPYGNAIVVGYKSDCCTSNNQTLYTDGSFDDIMVTPELLYR
ncbi:MAG: LamG domain-containing protein [Fibrobacter sp.]|nr:LamG domain-containing protein [Fibrobacter sp.]